MAIRRPAVEGEDTAQDGKPEEDKREPELLELQAETGLFERQHVEGVQPGGKVHRQHADQRDHRADKQVKGQLHPAVFARLGIAPDDDHQVFGENGHFKEEEQQEQVQRGEDAQDAGRQEHQKGKELARSFFHVPGDQHPAEDDDPGQQDQGEADPVDADVIGNPQVRQPVGPLDKLVPAG